jgi:hypothetical protein
MDALSRPSHWRVMCTIAGTRIYFYCVKGRRETFSASTVIFSFLFSEVHERFYNAWLNKRYASLHLSAEGDVSVAQADEKRVRRVRSWTNTLYRLFKIHSYISVTFIHMHRIRP